MKYLEIKPHILRFNNSKEFVDEFCVGKGDLIFTNKFLYEEFFKKLSLECDYIFQENYSFKEPSNDITDRIIREIEVKNYKRIIAIGGGSIIDISKILALKDVKTTHELFTGKISAVKDKELIVIPTTCGTGSEVTNISIVEIKEKETKIGLALPQLYPDYAVLIPELIKELPYEFFIYSSIDALIHAVESFVSPRANIYTDIFAENAIKIILNGYKDILENGKEYRKIIIEDFLVASNFAGISFGNAGVGAVHALSYPLGAKYHVPHGEANYQFFIEVFRLYAEKNPSGKINMVNKIIMDTLNFYNEEVVYHKLEDFLDNLIKKRKLREYGMKPDEIQVFTESVINQQQRLLINSYVPMLKDDITKVYSKLF